MAETLFLKRKRLLFFIILLLSPIIIYIVYNKILILDDWGIHQRHSMETEMEIEDGNTPAPDPGQQQKIIPGMETPAIKGYHIHINLDAKVMYVYHDGLLVRTYPVSGGEPSTPSPEGTWRVVHKDTWGDGFGGAWLGLNVPWGQYGIHGTQFPWLIGRKNASRGCIRMLSENAKELYKMAPYGTTVTIEEKYRPYRIMMEGDVGSDVRDIQIALSQLGYYPGSIDGGFGEGLKAGVIQFQKDNKLEVTGEVDKKTCNLINQKAKELGDKVKESLPASARLKIG